MQAIILFAIFSVAFVSVVTADCEQDINNCIAPIRSRYDAQIAAYTFDLICGDLQQILACYNLTRGSNCQNLSTIITLGQTSDLYEERIICDSVGGVVPCVISLGKCYKAYNTTAAKNPCGAASTAMQCLGKISNCTAQPIIASLQNDIITSAQASRCALGGGVCMTQAGICANASESLAIYALNKFDFDNVCTNYKVAQSCFSSRITSQTCAQERPYLQSSLDDVNSRYGIYCAADFTALPCLHSLDSCLNQYAKVVSLDQFTIDPLYECQGSSSLVQCLNGLSSNSPSGCPSNLTAMVQGIAQNKKAKADLKNDCGSILDGCTQAPARCVITQDIEAQKSNDMGDFDNVCRAFSEIRKCVSSPRVNGTCTANKYLVAENAYAIGKSTMMCNSSNSLQSVPCLKDVKKCIQSLLTVESNPQSLSDICNAANNYISCISGIRCANGNLQDFIHSTIDQHKHDECQGFSSSTNLHLHGIMILVFLLQVLTFNF